MKCILVIYIIALLQFERSLCNNEEDNWISPNAFDRYSESPDCAKCIGEQNHCTASNKDVAFIYYKKFIANLFSRKRLQYDKSSALYQRCLLFSLSEKELKKLETLDNARDLDTVITEIFSSTRLSKECVGNAGYAAQNQFTFTGLIWDILKDIFLLFKTSEGQFLLIVVAVAMFIWYIHRRYRIGIAILIISSIIVFGYFHTYIECNRKREAETLLELFDKHNERAPMWYNSLLSWFGSSDPAKEEQKDKIRKLSKLNLKYCRPDHVLIMYGNELFLKQLEMLMEKCVDTFKTMKENLPFPLNYIACGMVVVMICYMTKLTFKYILSPRAWWGLMTLPSFMPNQSIHPSQLPEPTSSADRISGDNLNMLLKMLIAPKETTTNSTSINAVSGVQEVLEQIETSTVSTDADMSTSTALPPAINKNAESKSNSNDTVEAIEDIKET